MADHRESQPPLELQIDYSGNEPEQQRVADAAEADRLAALDWEKHMRDPDAAAQRTDSLSYASQQWGKHMRAGFGWCGLGVGMLVGLAGADIGIAHAAEFNHLLLGETVRRWPEYVMHGVVGALGVLGAVKISRKASPHFEKVRDAESTISFYTRGNRGW